MQGQKHVRNIKEQIQKNMYSQNEYEFTFTDSVRQCIQ
jgi:hypothetical protein